MPVYLKPNEFHVKDESTGNYLDINAVAEQSTAQTVAAVTAEGTTQIDRINTRATEVSASLPKSGEMEDMVAVPFVQATAYPAGKYVIQEVSGVNHLYYLPNGHEANVTWENTTKVGPLNLGDETTSLKSALIKEITWDSDSDGKYIKEDGTIGTDVAMHYSDLLRVSEGKKIFEFSYTGAEKRIRIHGYNEFGVWVSQITTFLTTEGNRKEFTVPSTISNIRISCSKDAKGCILFSNTSDEFDDFYSEITFTDEQTITYNSASDGIFIAENGNFALDANMHYSNLIPVKAGKHKLVYDYTGSSNFTVRVHGYDTNGNWVRELAVYPFNTTGATRYFTSTDDVQFIRLSISKLTTNTVLYSVSYNNNVIKQIENELHSLVGDNSIERVIPVTWDAKSNGHHIGANGEIGNTPTFHYSDLLGVNPGYIVFSFVYSGEVETTPRVHGYDVNGKWVEQLLSFTNIQTSQISIVPIPQNIRYIRISIRKDATNVYVSNTSTVKDYTVSEVEKLKENGKEGIAKGFGIKISSLGRIDSDINSEEANGAYYSLCGYRNKIVDGKPSYPIGWLYQRSPLSGNSCELWYSANQIDKPVYLTTMSGFGSSSSQRSFEISPTHGDIITCQRDDRNAPYVYDASTGETTKITGLATNPIGWMAGRGGEFAIDGNGDEFFLFGEYTGKDSSIPGYEYLNVWKVTYPYTEASNWNIVYSIERASGWTAQEPGKPWHIHTVMRDPYTNVWYLTTGDQDTAVNWWYSADDGENWTHIHIGTDWETQISRNDCFIFTKEYIWWASDWGTNHSLNRLSRDEETGIADLTTHERVAELNKDQSTYATAYLNYPNGFLMIDNVDSAFIGNTDKITVQFYSLDDQKVYNLKTLSRKSMFQNEAFGFRCICYTLRQSPFETRIGVGFNATNVNKLDMEGNEENRLCTLLFDVM